VRGPFTPPGRRRRSANSPGRANHRGQALPQAAGTTTTPALERGPHARRAQVILIALALLVTGLMLSAQARAAAPTFSASFTCNVATPCGSITSGFSPDRLAVNEQTGNVYVIDFAHDAIVVFDANGTYLFTIPGSSTSPAGTFAFSTSACFGRCQADIAIDNSGGANQGQVYLVSEGESGLYNGSGGVFAFRADGGFLWQAAAGGGAADLCGVAVNASGTPYIADYTPGVTPIDPATGSETGPPLYTTGSGCQLDFDSQGNSYLRDYNTQQISKFGPSGSPLGTIDSGSNLDVAVDRSTDSVFTTHAADVAEYDSAGAAVSGTPFGSTELTGGSGFGVTVNGANHKAYVSDNGNNVVDIYDIPLPPHTLRVVVTGTGSGSVSADSGAISNCTRSGGVCSDTYADGSSVRLTATPSNATITWSGGGCSGGSTSCDVPMTTDQTVTVTFNQNKPTVGGESSSGIAQTGATLGGSANPNGAAATCEVEYGTTTGYGARAAVGSNPGSGTSAVAVSATVGGLSANTAYHWRLDCTNTGGTTNGSDQTFRTLAVPPPSATTGGASGVTETGATLAGSVNPNGFATSCRFEYGTTTAYGSSVDCASAPGAGSGAVGVSAGLTGLSGDTVYHYRLVATNAGGTVDGADATFTTTSPPPPVGCPADRSKCPPGTLTVKSSSVTVKSGKAPLKVVCAGSAGSSCSGKLRLTARVKHGRKRKTIVVGTVTVKLDAGQSATLSVKLSGAAKAALAKAPHKLGATVSGMGVRKAVTLKQPVRKRRRK